MRLSILLAVSFLWAQASMAASIGKYQFPWKNGPTSRSVYKMTDHPNAVFVFEAFAINCGYCHENAPAVSKLAEEYKSNPRVQVLDLGLDRSQAAYDEWIATHNPNHPVIQDVDRLVYSVLQTANGIPQVFIVNCKGLMVGNHVGTWAGYEDKIKASISTALETQCP